MSSGKRPLADDGEATTSVPNAKKRRHGFRVGPENLPDGPWRRKVTKLKKELIHKAKVKKQYAKVKAQHERSQAQPVEGPSALSGGDAQVDPGEGAKTESPLHPERQAMINGDREPSEQPRDPRKSSRPSRAPRGHRRPGYYDKELAQAERKRQETEARAKEATRREGERSRKIAERDRLRKQMARARKVGKDGRKKLGRESVILLEKVKKLVGGPKQS